MSAPAVLESGRKGKSQEDAPERQQQEEERSTTNSESQAQRLAALRAEVSLVGASEPAGEAARMRMNEFDEAIFDNTDEALKNELVRILVQVRRKKKATQCTFGRIIIINHPPLLMIVFGK
jgi:hypothetical protein